MFLNIPSAVLANTVYVDGKLVAKDVVLELPSVTFMTAEVNAYGKLNVTMPTLIEDMEMSVAKKGYDAGVVTLAKPGSKNVEFRWVQDVIGVDGVSKPVGCKAFFRCAPKSLPGMSLEPGNIGDAPVAFSVSRYQVIVDGEEQWLIDKLKGQLRVGGEDYSKSLNSML